MIEILFYPGTHGNYLEFILNKFLYGDKIIQSNPLGSLGTSHPQYDDNYRFFKGVHQNFVNHNSVIKIDFGSEDDLFVMQLNLKRGGDADIDLDTLTENTYFQLLNKFGPNGEDGPNKIIECINQYSEIDSYYHIKDKTWPDIADIDDFYNLPAHIIEECINQFKFKPFVLNEKHPHAPRYVLRDIFKSWFYNKSWYPSVNMKLIEQSYKNSKIYKIPLRNLYNLDLFIKELKNIEKYFNLIFTDWNLTDLHKRFVDKVPYKNSVQNCNNIISSVKNFIDVPIDVNVIEESFIDFKIEKEYNILMPVDQEKYFVNTLELKMYIDSKL